MPASELDVEISVDGDQALDDLALIAAATFDTPVAIICIHGGKRHWFAADNGLSVATMPEDGGLCRLVREQRAPLVVSDLTSPEWSGPHPSLTGVRFYAGVPLVTAGGHLVGTLCVEDYRPRIFSPREISTLEALGRQALTLLAHGIADLERGEGVSPEDNDDAVWQRHDRLVQSQTLQAVGQLAGGIAHEFNNILTVVIGQLSVLEMEFESGDPRRGDVRRIAQSADRAATLTRQLMAFSRHQRPSVQMVDLNALVQEHERMLQRLAGPGIHVTVALTDAACPVNIDPTHVEQVLLNLTLNARDAMPDGGTLRVETSRVDLEPGTRMRADDPEPGEYVALTVSDSGHGMSEDVRARIFEPFFTTKEVGKGTGLGLSTVYGIVVQSGGHIQVRSQAGAGASFIILLPCLPQGLLAGPATALPHVTPRGSETILVVDDNASLRNLTASMLRRHGYWVIEAAGGHDALALAARQAGPVHLLVTNAVLPGMTGASLARRLLPTRPDTRVLYLSEHADLPGGLGLPPDAEVVVKPFTSATLIARVRRLLDRSTTQGTTPR